MVLRLGPVDRTFQVMPFCESVDITCKEEWTVDQRCSAEETQDEYI